MRRNLILSITVMLFIPLVTFSQMKEIEVDICIYGGTSAGIIAAYTAKKQGKSVILIEPGNYLGGMTAGGLGATDIGNKYAISGLGKDFYRRVGAYYNKFEQWTFEPKVADLVFEDYIKEAQLNIVKNHRLVNVIKEDNWIKKILVENSKKPDQETNIVIKAKMFLDCTYEGDLMARSEVSYTVGRESNSTYNETFNGVQLSDYHQIPDGVDPYIIPGDPSSGLVWGISENKLAPKGSGDRKVQAYNFRLALTKVESNRIPFSRPSTYNADNYTLLLRILEKEKWNTIHSSFTVDKLNDDEIRVHHSGGFLIKNMPNGKTDFNNFGGFSTDMIGANHDYPDGDYDTRRMIWQNHVDYTKGLLYFLSHDSRVPAHIREEMNSWGYSKDEFIDLGGFSNQLYVREARRMVSDVVMTQNHSEGKEVVDDQIAMAAYQMDSHNVQRIIVDGKVKNEGDVQKRVPAPFPISYRSIVPRKNEVKNLLVPVCLSASHIAFGSIRMEPVFMVLGQSAATAAVQAINENTTVQNINVPALQEELKENPLANGTLPELIIDNDDSDLVKITGDWKRVRGGYGLDQLFDDDASAPKSIRYNPIIPADGKYEIFTYLAKRNDRSKHVEFTVHDGSKRETKTIETGKISEIALSSGEWISMGVYDFQAGDSSYLEINNNNADGVVTADAVIWKVVN